MRGNEFLDRMELVDLAYIEAAEAAPGVRRSIWTGGRIAVAACLCLVLLAGTALAVSGGGTWLVDMFTGREVAPDYSESGYELGAEIRRFPVSELSGEVRTVGEQIEHQFADYLPYSSRFPGVWDKVFPSAREAWEFIGLKELKLLDWDVGEPWETKVIVGGSASGAIKWITVAGGYDAGDIVLQTNTEIYTEYSDEEMGGIKVVSTENIEFAENIYTTVGGKQCQIISSSSALESGYLTMDGHLVHDGILYTLFVHCLEPDAARAEELLHQWADQF